MLTPPSPRVPLLSAGPNFSFQDDDKPAKESNTADSVQSNYIHIRSQQRNGRKCITTVTGLSAKLDLKKIQKAIKKEHCCNGTVLKDEETGTEVLQFQEIGRAHV